MLSHSSTLTNFPFSSLFAAVRFVLEPSGWIISSTSCTMGILALTNRKEVCVSHLLGVQDIAVQRTLVAHRTVFRLRQLRS